MVLKLDCNSEMRREIGILICLRRLFETSGKLKFIYDKNLFLNYHLIKVPCKNHVVFPFFVAGCGLMEAKLALKKGIFQCYF